jgi:O-antigen/teichoic acid export membrane protein
LEPEILQELEQTVVVSESPFQRLRKIIGLDRAIIYTIFARGWASAAGLVTIALIARFLSSAEQGYYYTFGSLVALQLVFELGFSMVIQQMASHECAHLKITDKDMIEGNPVGHARLASVLQKSVRWYSIASILMLCTIAPAGLYFFTTHGSANQIVSWHGPWLLVALMSSMAFQIDPVFSFLEGCGYVPQVAQTRFSQAITGSLLAWSALALHHGLFAPAMMIAGQVLAGGFYLLRRRRLLISLLRHVPGTHRIQWWKEVWPFQWRIAISSLSGYFIFQLFIPVLFAYWGPVPAGQMGMSLNISNALLSISISWVSTKMPLFGTLIARKEYGQLDHVFFRVLLQSSAVCLLGSFTTWTVISAMHARGYALAHRMLPPLPFGILLLSMMVNHIVFCEALYLRAHKQEKFLTISILVAVFMTCSTYLLGRPFGAIGMVSGYLSINACIALGGGTYTFLKYRTLWHGDGGLPVPSMLGEESPS